MKLCICVYLLINILIASRGIMCWYVCKWICFSIVWSCHVVSWRTQCVLGFALLRLWYVSPLEQVLAGALSQF
jgi:hypothetical protein